MIQMTRTMMSAYTTFELSKKYDDLWDQQDIAFHAISDNSVKQEQMSKEIQKMNEYISETQKRETRILKVTLQECNEKLILMNSKFEEMKIMLIKIRDYNARLEADLYNLKHKKKSSGLWYFVYVVIILIIIGKIM
jgi:hypothetical protein